MGYAVENPGQSDQSASREQPEEPRSQANCLSIRPRACSAPTAANPFSSATLVTCDRAGTGAGSHARTGQFEPSADSSKEPARQNQPAELTAGSAPTMKPEQDGITREWLLQIPFSQPKCIDLADTPKAQSEDTHAEEIRVQVAPDKVTPAEINPVEDPPISPASTEEQCFPSTAGVVLPQAIANGDPPEIQTAELTPPSTPANETDGRDKTLLPLISCAAPPKGSPTRAAHKAVCRTIAGEPEPLLKNRGPFAPARRSNGPRPGTSWRPIALPRHADRPRSLARKRRRKRGQVATPTLALAPAHWTPPVWLVGPAAAVFVLSTGLLGCFLSWSWAQDSYLASIVTDRLLTSDQVLRSSPLPESARPPAGGWTVSTAGHLAHWAIFLSRFSGEENQSSGKDSRSSRTSLDRFASQRHRSSRLGSARAGPECNRCLDP